MDIVYNCRFCGTKVGKINGQSFRTDQLGFDQLNTDERQEMIQYGSNGDINVTTVCEDCQEALERNPEYHQWDTFIQ